MKVHLGQSQELITSIHLYLKCKYTYENAGFCILLSRNFYQTIEIFHDFSRRTSQGTGANPPTPQRPYDVLVDKIDVQVELE